MNIDIVHIILLHLTIYIQLDKDTHSNLQLYKKQKYKSKINFYNINIKEEIV